MADTGRLDELKRKFDENPKRYFAPLANEYRKAGQPDVAIELCRTYLPQQPSHMSGYIVYGQALQDAGQADESAAVFKQALALDPENIIALRQLGDMARASGDSAGAMRWYGKVLELDPRNEEVSAYLSEIASPGGAPSQASGPERQAPPTIRPEPEPDASAVRLEDIFSEPDMQQMPIMADEPAQEQHSSPYTDEQSDQPFEVAEWPSAMAPGANESGESGEAPGSPDNADDSHVLAGPWHDSTDAETVTEQSFEVDSDTSEDAAPGSLRLSDYMKDEEAAFAPTPDELEAPAAAAEPEKAADRGPDHAAPPAGAAAAATRAASAMESPFVTETMAELYMRQGLRGEALTIYRQLALRRDDPDLHRRIAELEGEQASARPRETVHEFFERIGARQPNERVELAADRGSQLADLFAASQPDARDVSAAQRLSGAFGEPRSGSSQS
jgi:tetratricopeptide (TPR) repeat protein